MNILMSSVARLRLQDQVGELFSRFLPQQGLLWIDANGPEADLAFVSRDVTGRSTKQMILPETQNFYDALSRSRLLKWVHVHSAGTDRDIYQALIARGVRVTPSPGTNAKVVAQSALGGLLALARKLPDLSRAQQAHTWAPLQDSQTPQDLAGQRVVIVGWGAIAQQLAHYLTMLELKIIVVRYQAQVLADQYETVGLGDIHRVLPHADWLIIACPLTEATRRLLDQDKLALLPKSACLINIARGQIVDEQALIAALRSGHLAGAFLDVFEHEPLSSDSALWDLPQVIVTPHSAGFSDGNEARVDASFLASLEQYLADLQKNLLKS